MAATHKSAYQIAEYPVVVQATSTDLRNFLASLHASGASDLAEVEEVKALWAVQVPNGSAEGTTYVVSGETFDYVKAHRF